jgi:predicted SAM-dependent methyltransferase
LEPRELNPGSIDLIYSINVLEHTEDDRLVLSMFFDWIKVNGELLVYVPAFPHLYSKFDASIGHYRRYSKLDLEQKVLSAGFEVLSVKYADPVGYFVALLYRIFVNSGRVKKSQLRIFDMFLFPVSQRLQLLTGKLLGKNLVIHAVKLKEDV